MVSSDHLITQWIWNMKYVVKHKSAKLFMTYAVGQLEAALNICHLILHTSSLRVSLDRVGSLELVS